MKDVLGPNTNAPRSLLRPRCVLCAGEDAQELQRAWVAVRHAAPTIVHRYRCYEFWIGGDVSIIVTGIGTGTLEPLLFEVLQPGIIQRIVLIGTAGVMPGASVPLGRPFVVHQAYLAGTGLDAEVADEPAGPRWTGPMQIPAAASVSSDFFYGFSPRQLNGSYPLRSGRLSARYRELADKAQLVEMEVAPFYHFCAHFGQKDMQYVAIKAAANVVGHLAEQLEHTPSALQACLEAAAAVLGLERA